MKILQIIITLRLRFPGREREYTAYVCYMRQHNILENRATQKLLTVYKPIYSIMFAKIIADCKVQIICNYSSQLVIILAKNIEHSCLKNTLDSSRIFYLQVKHSFIYKNSVGLERSCIRHLLWLNKMAIEQQKIKNILFVKNVLLLSQLLLEDG